MSISALLRRADQPAVQLRRIDEAVADLRLQSGPPPPVLAIPAEALLDAALNARLSRIASGRAAKPAVAKPALETILSNAVAAAISNA